MGPCDKEASDKQAFLLSLFIRTVPLDSHTAPMHTPNRLSLFIGRVIGAGDLDAEFELRQNRYSEHG